VSQINKNLFVVGDPDQSIYEWRGARPDNLILFDTKYQPCKTIILNQNYRSYKNILDVANSVIEYNRTRISKNMFTEKKEMTKAIHFHGTSDKDEAEWVVGKIKKRLDENYDINKIAILFRASYISRSFEQSLINHNIPYVIYGGIRFFERKEIKDTLAYLKTIAIGDDISFRRIINIPSRKIGKVYMEKLTNISNIERTSLYDSLKSHPLLNLLI
jgi:DNA helicase-2/ATP-dependent DNA helicase PcrA